MAIFSFLARLGLDTAGFEAGVKRAESAATGLGKNIKQHIGGEVRGLRNDLAGLFTVAAVRGFAQKLSDTVGEIKDMSELLGISTDEVQRMQKAAADANQPFSVLVNAFNRIEQMRAQALTGDAKAKGVFGLLGIDPSQGNAFDVMRKAVDASQKGTTQTAAAFDLLGKKVSAFRVFMDELGKQGDIKLFSEEQIQAIDESTKALEEAARVFNVTVAPVVTNLLRGLTGIMNAPSSFVQMNKEMFAGKDPQKAFDDHFGRMMGMQETAERFSALPLPDRPNKYQIEAVSSGGSIEVIRVLRSIDNNTRKAGDKLEEAVTQ